MTNQDIVQAEMQQKFDILLDNFEDVLFKVIKTLKDEIDAGATADDLNKKYHSLWWNIDITNDHYARLNLVPEVFV